MREFAIRDSAEYILQFGEEYPIDPVAIPATMEQTPAVGYFSAAHHCSLRMVIQMLPTCGRI
jgi:hypothetical protein